MYEVVFGQSAAGSMRMAKSSGLLGGNPRQVVSLPLAFDTGSLRRDLMAEAGEDAQALLRAARAGAPLRIWWSEAPRAACGLRFVCHLLEGLPCPASAVRLPERMPYGADTAVSYSGWDEIAHHELPGFLPFERPLSRPERRALAMEWGWLVQEDAPLRAVINGRLMGVPEDFYDFLIRRCVPDGEFPMYELIGRTLSHALGLGDEWIAGRIVEMTARDELELVRDDPSPYRRLLRKAAT